MSVTEDAYIREQIARIDRVIAETQERSDAMRRELAPMWEEQRRILLGKDRSWIDRHPAVFALVLCFGAVLTGAGVMASAYLLVRSCG